MNNLSTRIDHYVAQTPINNCASRMCHVSRHRSALASRTFAREPESPQRAFSDRRDQGHRRLTRRRLNPTRVSLCDHTASAVRDSCPMVPLALILYKSPDLNGDSITSRFDIDQPHGSRSIDVHQRGRARAGSYPLPDLKGACGRRIVGCTGLGQ